MVLPEDARRLRQDFAVNHFKRALLGDRHVPGQPQTREVLQAIDTEFGDVAAFDRRTWESWFASSPPVAHPRTVRNLDDVARELHRKLEVEEGRRKVRTVYFRQLVGGGLLAELRVPTRSKKPRHILMERATDYQPLSAWHAHFDSIEASALAHDVAGVSWDVVKAFASERILQIVHARWNPRRGTVYSGMPSDVKLQWNAASNDERNEMRQRYAAWRPQLLNHRLDEPALPNWKLTGVEADIAPLHAHRLLFSISRDEQFLTSTRFEAWALDLATAALAMLAYAWSDRYSTFGRRSSGELGYWRAFALLFFEDGSEEELTEALHYVMASIAYEWPERSLDLLKDAGRWYRNELRLGGLSERRVWNVAQEGMRTHPLRYPGTRLPKEGKPYPEILSSLGDVEG